MQCEFGCPGYIINRTTCSVADIVTFGRTSTGYGGELATPVLKTKFVFLAEPIEGVTMMNKALLEFAVSSAPAFVLGLSIGFTRESLA